MMSDAASIALLFILVGGIITVLLLLTAGRGESRLRVGQAEWHVVFDKPWQHPSRRPAGRTEPRSAQHFLIVKGTRWRFPLREDQVLIGRSEACQIRLRDKKADSQQALIYWNGQRYRIRNLSRKTPTMVNSKPIVEQNLGNGNKIRMGRTELLFLEEHN